MTFKFSDYFPILTWGKTYKGETLLNDSIAALIVTIMLIPQSLAYALLAGLPPQVGLYASILPLRVKWRRKVRPSIWRLLYYWR